MIKTDLYNVILPNLYEDTFLIINYLLPTLFSVILFLLIVAIIKIILIHKS